MTCFSRLINCSAPPYRGKWPELNRSQRRLRLRAGVPLVPRARTQSCCPCWQYRLRTLLCSCCSRGQEERRCANVQLSPLFVRENKKNVVDSSSIHDFCDEITIHNSQFVKRRPDRAQFRYRVATEGGKPTRKKTQPQTWELKKTETRSDAG